MTRFHFLTLVGWDIYFCYNKYWWCYYFIHKSNLSNVSDHFIVSYTILAILLRGIVVFKHYRKANNLLTSSSLWNPQSSQLQSTQAGIQWLDTAELLFWKVQMVSAQVFHSDYTVAHQMKRADQLQMLWVVHPVCIDQTLL